MKSRKKLERELVAALRDVEILEKAVIERDEKLDKVFEIIGFRGKVRTAPIGEWILPPPFPAEEQEALR